MLHHLMIVGIDGGTLHSFPRCQVGSCHSCSGGGLEQVLDPEILCEQQRLLSWIWKYTTQRPSRSFVTLRADS